MRLYALVMAGKEVVDRSVFTVCNNRFGLDFRCCVVLLKQRKHQVGFVHIAGRCVGCRDDFFFTVNGPMHLVEKFGFPPVHQCRIRVGGAFICKKIA